MYGIVIKAIEGLVLERAGEEAWERIKSEAGAGDVIFISNQSYPDSLVYGLVGAAAKALGTTPESVLKIFGQYWIGYTSSRGYEGMLKLCGDDFRTFLKNLPDLHARVSLLYPEIQMPVFKTRVLSNGLIELTYESTREGLAPMVHGLLLGLADRFKVEVEVESLGTVNGDGTSVLKPTHRFSVRLAKDNQGSQDASKSAA